MNRDRVRRLMTSAVSLLWVAATLAQAELPDPVLNSVFPAGGQIGESIEVTLAGSALDGLETLQCAQLELSIQKVEANRFRIAIPGDAPAGLYDLRAVCRNGLSSPRTFFIGDRTELLDSEPNQTRETGQVVTLDTVINGRIEKDGDQDCFRFAAIRGQRVLIECWAERMDSQLRAVLEVYDTGGKRLAVNRGYFGIDPLIDFHVPADGFYVVRLSDLVYSGSTDHFYRLDIDTRPRVAFAVPCVVTRGTTTSVTLYGWNLRRDSAGRPELADSTARFEQVEVNITSPKGAAENSFGLRLRPPQVTVDAFAYRYPGSQVPHLISVTDVPVVPEQAKNQTQPDTDAVPRIIASAQEVSFPCEISGQLIAGDERDRYLLRVKRGEVVWFEAFGERIGSPVDLDLVVLDPAGEHELIRFSDEVKNIGGKRLPSSHLDPAGRWVVPADGRYPIVVRNLIGGLNPDPRRIYRLSIRREAPGFHLAVVPHRDGPAGINVCRGGRTIVEVFAFRHRGLTGPIRVSAHNLPAGISCPDIWLGPGVDRGILTVTADEKAATYAGTLSLKGQSAIAGGIKPTVAARGGTIVRSGRPNGWGRLTTSIPLAVAGQAPLRITADGHEIRKHHLYGDLSPRHSPGNILDVAVQIDSRDALHSASVKLTGVGLPPLIRNQTATIPAGSHKGHISFYLPPTLPAGPYTIAVRAETTPPSAQKKPKPVSVFSNPITFEVQLPGFILGIAPDAPRKVKRGSVVLIDFTAERINGFINKIHTELAAPEKVVGLRVRGMSFVGQKESGTLQIVANDDAPLGRQPFLRLYAVGVLEDEPVFQGSCFLNLEIIE